MSMPSPTLTYALCLPLCLYYVFAFIYHTPTHLIKCVIKLLIQQGNWLLYAACLLFIHLLIFIIGVTLTIIYPNPTYVCTEDSAPSSVGWTGALQHQVDKTREDEQDKYQDTKLQENKFRKDKHSQDIKPNFKNKWHTAPAYSNFCIIQEANDQQENPTQVNTAFKRVDQKIKPVAGTMPEETKVLRRFPEDPLKSLVPLVPNIPPFTPTTKLTQERIDKIEINKDGFM